tara:strand:- start:2934 stop:4184 length:1251 start_codon:yes stop_codon:yes gene_type:complete
MISLQSTSRSRFSRSTTRTRFLHITAISAAAIGSLFAQFDEKPEALSAKEWWNNANWLKTDLWEVRDRVETTDFDNHYVIDSIYGTFDAWGDDQLKKRIKEIQAIHRLREKGAARATSDGLVNETKKRINVAEDLAKTPVTTVLDVPRGARAIVRRAGAFQHRERRKGNYKGDGPLKSWLGVDDQKRQIAAKLGIDPYTDNLVLQKELDRVSTIGSLPELAVNYIDPGSGLFSVLESGRQSRMKDAYLNSPSELFVQNRRTLIEELGASKALAAQFLSVEFATPAQQTILVESLVQLKNTKNRLLLVQLANLTKTRAEFEVYRRCAELLAWYHSNRSPISKLTSLRWMPVGVDQSGNRVLPFPIDFGSWCPECGGFLTEFSETGEGGTLVMTGRLTERALSELAKRNVDVVFLDHE